MIRLVEGGRHTSASRPHDYLYCAPCRYWVDRPIGAHHSIIDTHTSRASAETNPQPGLGANRISRMYSRRRQPDAPEHSEDFTGRYWHMHREGWRVCDVRGPSPESTVQLLAASNNQRLCNSVYLWPGSICCLVLSPRRFHPPPKMASRSVQGPKHLVPTSRFRPRSLARS